ncbi:MAG: ABC transporter permease [Chloroflexi bacterium]|nr:ABC transporter permease [Chloroflexota bacterium]
MQPRLTSIVHTFQTALRNLRARPSRTLLTTFGIVLGVAVILAISITNFSTLDSITAVFTEASGKAHLVITSANVSGEGFDENVMRRVNQVAGIKAAVPSLQAQALLADEAAPNSLDLSIFGAVASGMTIYGIDPTIDHQARDYKIVAGNFLGADSNARDIIIVKDYAEKKKLSLGTDIQLVTSSGVEKLRLVGLMSKEGPGQLNNGAFGAIPLKTAQKIFSRPNTLDLIDIVAATRYATGDGLDTLKANLQTKLGDEYSVIYPAARGKRVTQMLDGYQMGLNFFSVLAIFVGAFLIYNAFSMTIVERTREIGMLRTLGMTRGQIMQQILVEATILGVVGSVLGVIVGIALSQGLIRGTELLLAQQVKQLTVPPEGLALSLGVGILVTILAASIPAWQASRISPLEALRIRGSSREGWIVQNGWRIGLALVIVSYFSLNVVKLPPQLEYSVSNMSVMTLLLGGTLLVPITVDIAERAARPWIRRIYGDEGQLGSRNTQRSKFRTALTVAALMIGVAMILSVRAISGAFEQDIRSWIEVYIGGDLYVHSSLPMRTDLGKRIEVLDGIAAVAPIRYFDVRRVKPDGTSDSLVFTAVEPASYQQVTSFVFTANQGEPQKLLDQLANGDVVFVSSVISEKYGIKQGDKILLETRRGKQAFEVGAVVVDFNNQGLVIEGSWKDMRRYFALNDVSAYLIKVKPGFSQAQVQKQIDDLFGKRRHITVESNNALKSRALSLTAQTSGLFDVMAVIAMIVAALGIINTMTMSVMERTREIGMLRSLGMTRWQIRKMILAEAGMMGIIGGVFGLVFGLFQSRIVILSINTMAGYDLDYVMPTQGIVIGLVVALVVSQLAAILPARRAAGLRIIEAIQFE